LVRLRVQHEVRTDQKLTRMDMHLIKFYQKMDLQKPNFRKKLKV